QFCALEARRSAARRRKHEQEAAAMPPSHNVDKHEIHADDVALYLDGALNKLSPTDRTALILRYLREKSFVELAKSLGTTEQAAKKPVTRALERLRKMLSTKGVAAPAALLGAILTKQAMAAPPGLAEAACSAALTGTTASIPSLLAKLTIQTLWKASA